METADSRESGQDLPARLINISAAVYAIFGVFDDNSLRYLKYRGFNKLYLDNVQKILQRNSIIVLIQ